METSNKPLGQRFLRLRQVLQIIPVSRSTWWLWVKQGRAPAPVKLGPRVNAWRADDLAEIANQHSERAISNTRRSGGAA